MQTDIIKVPKRITKIIPICYPSGFRLYLVRDFSGLQQRWLATLTKISVLDYDGLFNDGYEGRLTKGGLVWTEKPVF